MVLTRVLAAGFFVALVSGPVSAHDGIIHENTEQAQSHLQHTAGPDTDFPLNLGGTFELTDQNGTKRTETEPDGHPQLLFFGYANCRSICVVALPLMAEITDKLAAENIIITPVMVTVDPQQDTVETMGPALTKHHKDFIGLTGTKAELQEVYDLFSIENKIVFIDPEFGPVYAHGSHIYLLDARGQFITLLPPVLTSERMVEIIKPVSKRPR